MLANITHVSTFTCSRTKLQVMYVVTIPYLLLIIFFILGMTLPGAGAALKYLFMMNFDALTNPNVRARRTHIHATSFSSLVGIIPLV